MVFYSLLVRIAQGWLARPDIPVWTRNGVRAGIVHPFVSDIDLTIDCRLATPDASLKLIKRYRALRKILPVLGEVNWIHPGSQAFLREYGNPLELRRDPELLFRIGHRAAAVTDAERLSFLLRMLIADFENLGRRPSSRRKKWQRHLQECGLTPTSECFGLESLLEAMSPLLQRVSGPGEFLKNLEQPRLRTAYESWPTASILVFVREWLNKSAEIGNFDWAVRSVDQMSLVEREVLRAQLLWELAYVCLGEARMEEPAQVAKHSEAVLVLLKGACSAESDWSEILEAFGKTGLLDPSQLRRLEKLKVWKTLASCSAPWVGFCVRPDGKAALCELALDLDVRIQPGNSVDSVFSDAPFEGVRALMQSGRLPANCRVCVRQEQVGQRSLRMSLNERTAVHRGEVGVTEPRLRRLHLSFDNECSLACLTCSCRRSRKWGELLRQNSERSGWADQSFFDQIRSNLPWLEEIDLSGGDPLRSPSHEAFLDACLASGNAGRITLAYRGCALSDPRAFFDRWSRFRRVIVVALLDGHYEKEPYVRHPSSWSELSENLHRYDAVPQNVAVDIGHTLHALSVYYLPELCGWIAQQRFSQISTGRTGRKILTEQLSDSNFLSLPNCSPMLRGRVRQKLLSADCANYFSHSELEQLVSQIEHGTSNGVIVPKMCKWLDTARGTCFERALPEMAEFYGK